MSTHARSYSVKHLRALLSQGNQEHKTLELVAGALHEKPGNPHNDAILRRVSFFLNAYVVPRRFGRVTTNKHYLIDNHDVYMPDVAFVLSQNNREMDTHIYPNSPDFAFEIINTEMQYQWLQHKVKNYFRAGTKLIWVAYPDGQTIETYALSKEGRVVVHVRPNDAMLTGESLLPEFKVPVHMIFRD